MDRQERVMMSKRISLTIWAVALSLVLTVNSQALSKPAKKRSITSQPEKSLRQRYNSLVCAIALIQTERGTGTGFFVDSDGDMATAAHVVSTKNFRIIQNQVLFDVSVDQHISVTPHGESSSALEPSAVEVDKAESARDLVLIHTNLKPPCWIPIGNPSDTMTGDHLLSIGFPGIDNGNPILYEGFLSGRFQHPPIAVAQVNGEAILPHYEVMKVQMPITPGASGSPVIDDSGHAIAVISESPLVWTRDLESITRAARSGSGITLSGFDVVKILGQLAIVVREFESPGSGYAVPISGLMPTPEAVPSAPKSVH
jgi:S1-C subfamily serine protease